LAATRRCWSTRNRRRTQPDHGKRLINRITSSYPKCIDPAPALRRSDVVGATRRHPWLGCRASHSVAAGICGSE